MTFRSLPVGARFNFDHTGLPVTHGLESGPWYKVSARCYKKDTTPFGTPEEAREHQQWNGWKCQVGSVNVAVERLE